MALLSRVLVSLGITTTEVSRVLSRTVIPRPECQVPEEGVHPEWASWCRRWYHHATRTEYIRRHNYQTLVKVGRWLAQEHPGIAGPQQWTAELAAAFVAAVDRLSVGDWSVADQSRRLATFGQPLQPRTKAGYLAAARAFFRDCQEWGWIPVRFDPGRSLRTPRTVRALIGPDPRVIDDALWPKIVHAALNLGEEDLPRTHHGSTPYPLEMVRALAAVWCGAALRTSDIRRLRVGCIRWQREDTLVPGSDEVLPRDAVCFLDVPTNKTSTAYTKPVSTLVGQRVEEWERLRPRQPLAPDTKTSERVAFLFSYRGQRISRQYINDTLIPLLCRRAGVPEEDARGPITGHRARSTLATLLLNAKHPLSLFQLQAFLGHRSLVSTQHYALVTPTRLAKAVADAGVHEALAYAARVLIDQDAVVSGAAATGEPWKYYDLGHGYCTSAYFTSCPHRMACVRCDWYLPKGSARALYLESKANMARMKEELPLTPDERAVVEGDLEKLGELCARLADVPTPAGPPPRQLAATFAVAR
ncbi:MAG: site-specific integrase [Chloroflexota bacterium]|nr:site-specific integrase [Chloroflexota bacterium]